MAELKTKATTKSVTAFLKTVAPADKQRDSFELLSLMEKATGEKAVLWGTSIVGFGQYHYKSERSRQEGDWPLVGFSPCKQNLTLYIMAGNQDSQELFAKLGHPKTSVGCVYLKSLAGVDLKVLAQLIKKSYTYMRQQHVTNRS